MLSSECPPGLYGVFCDVRCDCSNKCNWLTGKCITPDIQKNNSQTIGTYDARVAMQVSFFLFYNNLETFFKHN